MEATLVHFLRVHVQNDWVLGSWVLDASNHSTGFGKVDMHCPKPMNLDA